MTARTKASGTVSSHDQHALTKPPRLRTSGAADSRTLPLIKRKRRLHKLIPRSGPLLYADHVERNGCALYAAACQRDLEGIVAKLKTGLYTPEEPTWVKSENPNYSQAEERGSCSSGDRTLM